MSVLGILDDQISCNVNLLLVLLITLSTQSATTALKPSVNFSFQIVCSMLCMK